MLITVVPILTGPTVALGVMAWWRRGRVERARGELRAVQSDLLDIEGKVQPLVTTEAYIPEAARRPLATRLAHIIEADLPALSISVGRVPAPDLQEELERLRRRSGQLRAVLGEHNARYVQRAISEHSKLLVQEVGINEAQLVATVRDDLRNLVIAGAGSGKTRTIMARIRYLLECGLSPTAILAITFTNKATEEMEERLRSMGVPIAAKEGVGGVTVATVHALGKRTVQAKAPGRISVADDNWAVSLVARSLKEAREGRDPELVHLYVGALLHFHRQEDERAPALGGDKRYRTLRGEHVRSIGERIVADFLFLHHVDYRYEAEAAWAEVGEGHDAYHPDFTLPALDTSIEYWGISRSGEVAAWFTASSEEYRKGMEWKREQFRRKGKALLEFYDYERTEGTLEDLLRERLTAAGTVLRPVGLDEVGKVVGDFKYVGSVIEKLLLQFVTNARAMRRSPEDVRLALKDTTPRVHHFGLLGMAILERYEQGLRAEGRMDFADMLHKASDILEAGVNPLSPFQHVLVDEFQDTSPAMARFLKALLAASGARLFAVGDDWQAIYGFAGGDVEHIVNFEEHFGPASVTLLDVNYRSPMVIVEAGAALIAHNPKQVAKQVRVSSREQGEAYVHEVADDAGAIVDYTIKLIREELTLGAPEDILVLSRTNHVLWDIEEACQKGGMRVAGRDVEAGGIRIMSAHKAKGLEAPVVIVVNASDHRLGFPSKVENPDVIEPVRMSRGNDEAEERRLFYVAISRANKRLHLVAREGRPSPYIAEIEGQDVAPTSSPSTMAVGARLDGLFSVEHIFDLSERQVGAHIRQRGILVRGRERFGFTSWAPVHLKTGNTYYIWGLLNEQPFQGQPQAKLDGYTRVEFRSPPEGSPRRERVRALRPRPPPSHQPRIYQRQENR